ncbi:hypothetical protein AB0L00_12120 [Actinoallomurus sp. NPDC052308]|uniref:hypothetical protein n=1 Tax=Actinoallomurus sp. NPDC052308 TaxID=3155530 RepID=UPI00341680C9
MCSAIGDLPPGRGAVTRVDRVAFGRAPDPVWEARWVWLHRLRREFPGWIALFDPFASVWVAVRGRQGYVTGATAYELRDRLDAVRRSTLP